MQRYKSLMKGVQPKKNKGKKIIGACSNASLDIPTRKSQ
jgi:hypothetical protein